MQQGIPPCLCRGEIRNESSEFSHMQNPGCLVAKIFLPVKRFAEETNLISLIHSKSRVTYLTHPQTTSSGPDLPNLEYHHHHHLTLDSCHDRISHVGLKIRDLYSVSSIKLHHQRFKIAQQLTPQRTDRVVGERRKRHRASDHRRDRDPL